MTLINKRIRVFQRPLTGKDYEGIAVIRKVYDADDVDITRMDQDFLADVEFYVGNDTQDGVGLEQQIATRRVCVGDLEE